MATEKSWLDSLSDGLSTVSNTALNTSNSFATTWGNFDSIFADEKIEDRQTTKGEDLTDKVLPIKANKKILIMETVKSPFVILGGFVFVVIIFIINRGK
jgi:hypothetical protein